jgi:Putative prokaryotic signal transducing protein
MELVTVQSFDNYFSANILLTRLQAEGIECYLKDENTVTIDPILSNAIGGIKLVVKKEDEDRIIKLIRSYHIEYLLSATCPECGSNSFNHVAKAGVGNYLTAILTWLFSSYAVAPEYVYQCGNCGYECETLPGEDLTHEWKS